MKEKQYAVLHSIPYEGMKIEVWEVLVNWTGDWASSFGHWKYFSTKERAEKAIRDYEEQNNYRPDWRITKKTIEIN